MKFIWNMFFGPVPFPWLGVLTPCGILALLLFAIHKDPTIWGITQ